jgi:glyoxylase I family protein
VAALQHIALNCRDRQAQESFFCKHLGFRRARVFNHGQPNEFVMLRLGGVCLELFGAGSGERGGEQAVGFKHLAFEVDSLDASIAALRADGFEMGKIIDCAHHCPGMRVCFFRDADGNLLELMEGYCDQENPPPPTEA